MRIRDLFEKWDIRGLTVKAAIMERSWDPGDSDRDAAWEIYVELLTRITTQALPQEAGVEQSALDSVYSLFGITRETLKKRGRACAGFMPVGTIVINQIVRPFTAKWHKLSQEGAFEDDAGRQAFREELAVLQVQLRNYARLLADVAGVDDLTDIGA